MPLNLLVRHPSTDLDPVSRLSNSGFQQLLLRVLHSLAMARRRCSSRHQSLPHSIHEDTPRRLSSLEP
ncbi:hypothetical protein IG631_22161 [Alternaria alternata]|nr:hypothetical protein IG631_22161 [Alternaria alternata]